MPLFDQNKAADTSAADSGVAEEKPSLLATLRRYSAQQKNERYCATVLRDYLRVLQNRKHKYAPSSPDEIPDDRYAESCILLDPVERMLDTLSHGLTSERAEAVDMLLKDGQLAQVQERVRQIIAEDRKEV